MTASYEGGAPDPDPDPDPEPDGGEIENGEILYDLSGSEGDMLVYYIDVPENATNLDVVVSGGDGDADLYTRIDAEPTTEDYDCLVSTDGNRENCTEASPGAGRWYIGLYGYTDFSGVSLTASYEEGDVDPEPDSEPVPDDGEIENSVTFSDLSGSEADMLLISGQT
jgi:serine protease